MKIKKQVDLMYKAHVPEPLSRKKKKERKKAIKAWIINTKKQSFWAKLDAFHLPSHLEEYALINWVNPKDPR